MLPISPLNSFEAVIGRPQPFNYTGEFLFIVSLVSCDFWLGHAIYNSSPPPPLVLLTEIVYVKFDRRSVRHQVGYLSPRSNGLKLLTFCLFSSFLSLRFNCFIFLYHPLRSQFLVLFILTSPIWFFYFPLSSSFHRFISFNDYFILLFPLASVPSFIF